MEWEYRIGVSSLLNKVAVGETTDFASCPVGGDKPTHGQEPEVAAEAGAGAGAEADTEPEEGLTSFSESEASKFRPVMLIYERERVRFCLWIVEFERDWA